MKFRNTLILLLVAGALLAYVGLVERDRKTTSEAAEASNQVLEFDRDKINHVTIKNPEAKIEFTREGQSWQMSAEPIKDRADSMTLNQLFTTMETLRHDAKIEPEKGKDNLKEYGVADSDIKVTFSGEGQKPVELLIGHDAAVEGKIYARLASDDAVFVIPSDLKNQLTKKADDYRDRKLTELTTQQVTKVTVKSKAGETELEKKDNHWTITKPLQARADDSKINDMVAQVTTARIDQFVNEPNLASLGLAEPRATITLHTEEGAEPAVLQLGDSPKDEKDKEKVYAKLSTRDSVVLVSKDLEKLVAAGPNDLRDRNLVRVESDIVDRITIEPAGKEKLVLARKGESWVRKVGDQEQPVNSALPNGILADLQSTQVTNFVSDTATNLAEYGLEPPALKVTLSSYASDNTSETKAGEQEIVSVLIGKQEGDNGYAKLDSEPFVVAVPNTLIAAIPRDPVHLQDLTILDFDPKSVTALEVTRKGQPTVSLQKEKDTWKPAKGDAKVNAANIEMLVNTLAVLRTTRWVGPTDPASHGTAEPELTVSYTVGEGDKKTTGKLAVGKPTDDGNWFATIEGRPGTFVLTKPDYDNLHLALVDTPAAPAASATTPATPAGAAAPAPGAAPAAPPTQTPAEAATPAVPAPAPAPQPVPEPAPAPAPAPEPAPAPVPEAAPAAPAAPAPEAPAPAAPAPAAGGELPLPQPDAPAAPAAP